jgi:hypothetical protein
MIKCDYFKKSINNCKCKLSNSTITLLDCIKCTKFKQTSVSSINITPRSKSVLKGTKTPLKKISKKHAKSEKNRYSILVNNMNVCAECGKINCELNKHEIFYGTGKRALSIKYGLVIPLCTDTCHNQYKSKGIHFDKEMCLKWHKTGQLKAMEYYNWTKEEFIKVFGKNYLD